MQTLRTWRSLSPTINGRPSTPSILQQHCTHLGRTHRKPHSSAGCVMSTNGSSRSLIPLLPSLTPSQILTAKKTWKHVNTKGLKAAIMRCFQRLEATRPSVEITFNSIDHQLSASTASIRSISDHANYIVEIIGKIIDGEKEAMMNLRQAGACHAKLREQFDITEEDLEILGELLAETFSKLDGIRQSKEASKLWRMLIASVIDELRVGFETESRMQQRCRMLPSVRSPLASAFELTKAIDRRNSVPARFLQSVHAARRISQN